MSGGSWNYVYKKIEEAGVLLQQAGGHVFLSARAKAARIAFGRHLVLAAEAMRYVEWVDSGDCGPDDEVEAIEAVIGKDAITRSERDEMLSTIADVEKRCASVRAALGRGKCRVGDPASEEGP